MEEDGDLNNNLTAQDIEININLIDILEYVGDSVRPIREGLAVKDAGHIVCIGYTKIELFFTHVRAYVLQSSHPRDKPHEIILKLHKTDIRQWDLSCSCKANTRRCKHIVASLMQLNQFKTLEYISCTDATQAWGFSKAEKVSLWGARLVQDLCCIKQPKIIKCTNENMVETVLADSFKRLIEAAPQSAISKHRAGRNLNPVDYRSSISFVPGNTNYCTEHELTELLHRDHQPNFACDLNPVETEFYKKVVEKRFSEILQIALQTQNQSDQMWLFHRSMRITASSCYSLFTYTKNVAPDWSKKIQQFTHPKTVIQTKAMRYGKTTEAKAFDCYYRKRNSNVRKTGFIIDQREPWLGGSPDGLDCLSKLVLEIKCPASGEMHDLNWIVQNCKATKKYVRNDKEGYNLNPKHPYYAQVQINMFIANCTITDFIIYSLFEDDFIVIEVPLDNNYVKVLVATLKDVYFRKILPALAEKTK